MSAVKHILVIEGAEEGMILASIGVVRSYGVLFLVNLSTDPEVRAEGYASQLLTEAVARFGHEDLYVHALPFGDRPLDDTMLPALYEKFGFEKTGVFPGGMVRHADLNGGA